MIKQHKRGFLLLGTLFLLPLVPHIHAADVDPLFLSSQTLNISLSGPFTTIDRKRDKEEQYTGGSLTYLDQGQQVTLDVKFKVRGNYRLRKDVCSHAQLWLDFDKEQVAGTLFENQNKLKLVVQCRNRLHYRNTLLKEHQVYQLYNTISDLSFRTRLVNILYEDTDRDRSRSEFGIIIEHKDRLADRTGMNNVSLNKIDYRSLDPLQGTIAGLFMYLTGNTDFSFISAHEDECCHNAILLHPVGEKRYFPVPYDFDSTGYVDASYAEVNPGLPLRSVRQRLYRGFCVPQGIMNEALAPFRANQEQILSIASDSRYLDENSARKSVEYLQAFFDIINDPEKRQDEIIKKCRG